MKSVLCMFLIILCIYIQNATAVFWNPVEPVQFYENACLICHLGSNGTGTPKWTGGYLDEIITYNAASFYKDKYTVHYDNNQKLYYLNISNFDENDVNVVYTCFYGFQKYSRKLTLDKYRFELVPNEKTIKRHICLNNTALTLTIAITNVWPDPFCHLFINNQLLNYTARSNSSKEGTFLHFEYSLDYEFDQYQHEISVNITCVIGTKHRIWHKIVPNLSEPPVNVCHKNDTVAIAILISVVASVTFALSLLFCWWICSKKCLPQLYGIDDSIVYGQYHVPQLNSASNACLAAGPKPGRKKEEGK